MSSIDLAIPGTVLEKPQSAYDIQKDVESHHFSRWTRISAPSIYRLQWEQAVQGRRARSRAQREAQADRNYALRQEKRKAKHRGK